MRVLVRRVVTSLLCGLLVLHAAAASLTPSKPEDVGISSERLQRIQPLIRRHIDAKDFAGAVTVGPFRLALSSIQAQAD